LAFAFVQEFKVQDNDRSTTNYDAVSAQLNVANDRPDGAIFHTAGFDDEAGVFRIFDVWETREQGERFLQERLQPIIEELSANRPDATPPDRQGWYELHDLLR
jgi:hypothetical protein